MSSFDQLWAHDLEAAMFAAIGEPDEEPNESVEAVSAAEVAVEKCSKAPQTEEWELELEKARQEWELELEKARQTSIARRVARTERRVREIRQRGAAKEAARIAVLIAIRATKKAKKAKRKAKKAAKYAKMASDRWSHCMTWADCDAPIPGWFLVQEKITPAEQKSSLKASSLSWYPWMV